MKDFNSPETVSNDILFPSFQCRSQPSEAWKFSVLKSLAKITAENGTFWLCILRNQLKIAWSTNCWLPDFNFYLLTLVPFFSASKSFSLILTQVDKVLLGTINLAATFLLLSPFSRSLSAWHFPPSILWVYIRFPATNILRTNNTTTWRKNNQKTHTSIQSVSKHSNISTFGSSIWTFEHFDIRMLVTMHIIKALRIKNGTMSVHLRR